MNTLTIDQLNSLTLDALAGMELAGTEMKYPVTAAVVIACVDTTVNSTVITARSEANVNAKIISITFVDSWS